MKGKGGNMHKIILSTCEMDDEYLDLTEEQYKLFIYLYNYGYLTGGTTYKDVTELPMFRQIK